MGERTGNLAPWLARGTRAAISPRRLCAARCVAGALICFAARLAAGEAPGLGEGLQALKRMSIEELLEVSVTSASRRPQQFGDAAAAIFVISREDIRRSGATSIPELLRMAPGVQVAQIDASKWAISARGFNSRYSSKLLVQLDGRTLYSPLYSGVYWDVQDTMLEDIERIEVIRGPGATLWGSNAVNGVINIITRSAGETTGGLLSLGAGTEDRALAAFRFGAPLGDAGAIRAYVKGRALDAGRMSDGAAGSDDWRDRRVGLRADVELSATDTLTFEGDYYDSGSGAAIGGDLAYEDVSAKASGGNLLGRWVRRIDPTAGWELKAYYDQTRRSSWTVDEVRDTFDLDWSRYAALGERHILTWGLGYRLTRDQISTEPGAVATLQPDARTDETLSGFLQDEIALLEGDLHLILGSKLEHNDYSGWELQPNLRLLWGLHPRATLWAAVSRALRTPSRFESDVTIQAGQIRVSGNPELRSERLTAYELGLRLRPLAQLSLDLTAFVNDYDRLVGYAVARDGAGLSFDNGSAARGHGLELAGNWQVTPRWTLKLAYSWLDMRVETESGASSLVASYIGSSAPSHQAGLRSWLDLGSGLEMDLNLYYVDELANFGTEDYLRLDLRLGWRPAADVDLSLIGKNLLDDRHPELTRLDGGSEVESLVYTQVERSLTLQARWSF